MTSFNQRKGCKRGKSEVDRHMQFNLDDDSDDDKNISESQVKEEVELQDKEANDGTTIEEIDPEKAS